MPGRGRQLPLTAALAVVGAGLLLVSAGSWRVGAVVIGAGVLLAGVLRLVLPVRRTGLLAVRSRPVDATLLLLGGLGLVLLALSVPEG